MICVFVEKSPENIRSYIYFPLSLSHTLPPPAAFYLAYYFYHASILSPHALYTAC